MKKLGNWIIIFLGAVVTVILILVSSTNLLELSSSGLNTQKIDKM